MRGRSRWMRFQQYGKGGSTNDSLVTKNVILAMAQRGEYFLSTGLGLAGGCQDSGKGSDDRWTLEFIANSSNKLDTYSPNLMALERIVNNFCKKMYELIDEWQENLCKYNEALNNITEARLSIEKEMCQLAKRDTQLQEATMYASAVEINDDHHSRKHLISQTPASHPPVIKEDEYILSVYDQFVNSIFMAHPIVIRQNTLVGNDKTCITTVGP